MRFASFEIQNYKGIARAKLQELATEPVVTISGRNGTGKSLILEALVGAWSQRIPLAQRIGPWSDTLSISISVHLTEEEWEAVDSWHRKHHGGQPVSRGGELTFTQAVTRSGAFEIPQDSTVMQILRNNMFQREHPFGIVDFLPANRLVPSVPSPSVDLGMLNIERVEQERFSMVDQYINSRSAMSLPSVANYLVTLDYQAFLAARQGLRVENEYERLASAFKAATGKNLLLPEYDTARGSTIEVQLPVGHRHGLMDLSSGEQEMLAMMYFVRRLSAAGGVLCIDEPEQHLHPTLQAALFEAMQGMAARAQVLVVSHSVNLIAAAPLAGLVQVAAPKDVETNQATRLQDAPEKASLVGELGITPADLLQSDLLLVVEGDSDARWLRALFPVELGRAHVIVAGSGSQVIASHETLSEFSAGVPWLCLLDRDLRSGEEVRSLVARYNHLYVWPRRAIESHFLDPSLISVTLESVGKQCDPFEVEKWLREASDPLMEEVLSQLVERELSRRFPAPPRATEGNRYSNMETHLLEYSTVNLNRANAVEETARAERERLEARWQTDRLVLVNPKPVFAEVAKRAGAFKTSADLISALVVRCRDEVSTRPAAFEALRVRLSAILTEVSP